MLARELERARGAVVFQSANFSWLPAATPQLLLARNPIYFDPLYAEHVLPGVPARERLGVALRRNLCLASAHVARRVITPTTIPDRRDDVVNASLGVKLLAAPGLTVITNGEWPLDRGGLRPDIIWTLGMEYNF